MYFRRKYTCILDVEPASAAAPFEGIARLRKRIFLLALAAAPTAALAQQPPQRPATPPPARPAERTVGEVVVTAQAPAVQTSIDRRSYSVAGDLQAQTGSLADALRNVPSLEVDIQGNVSLRGDRDVTILVDGKPSSQFDGDNRGQALQALPADRIDRVEVITNPSAEFRADGTGGVINLVTKQAKGAGRTGSARLTAGTKGRVFASANLGFNGEKLSVTGDLNLRHDNQKQLTVEDRERLDPVTGGFDEILQTQDAHSTFDSSTARVAADYDLDSRTRLSAELRGAYVDFTIGGPSLFEQTSSTGAETAFARHFDIHQLRGNGVGVLSLRRKLGAPGHELTASLTYDATDDDRVRKGQTTPLVPAAPSSVERQVLNFDYRRAQLKSDYVRPMGEGAVLKAGVDLQTDDNAYDNAGFRGPSAVPDPTLTNLFLFEQTIAQAYVTYERPVGDLTVLAGLRLEDVNIDLRQATLGERSDNDYRRAYPSLHLGWKLDDDRKLSASYSHRVQRPNPLQFNTFRFLLDPLNYRSGNAGLKPSETHSLEFGYERRAGPGLFLATAYYRDNDNGITDVIFDLGDGVFVMTSANITKSRNVGLELVASGKLGSTLTYNLSGNLYWTEMQPQPLGAPEVRSAFGASGRGSLTWQATPKDLFQLNGSMNGKQLTPQGHVEPMGALHLGYRRKLTDQLAFTLTVLDIFQTIRFRQVIDTPVLRSRLKSQVDTRQVQLGLVWTFGGGRPRGPDFDFGAGGAGPPQ